MAYQWADPGNWSLYRVTILLVPLYLQSWFSADTLFWKKAEENSLIVAESEAPVCPDGCNVCGNSNETSSIFLRHDAIPQWRFIRYGVYCITWIWFADQSNLKNNAGKFRIRFEGSSGIVYIIYNIHTYYNIYSIIYIYIVVSSGEI